MGFTARFNFYSIQNHAAAADRYASIKPIRTTGERPLDKRTKKYVEIVELKDGEGLGLGNSFVCRLYRTDVVTFRPDNTIEIRMNNWSTASTASFIQQTLGTNCSVFDNRLWIRAEVKEGEEKKAGWYPLDPTVPNIFTRSNSPHSPHRLTFINPVFPNKTTINRKVANVVRKQYGEFRKYLVGSCKLRDNGAVSTEEAVNAGMQSWGPREIMEWVRGGTAESFYKAHIALAMHYGQYAYNTKNHYLTPDRAKVAMDKVLFATHPEVFIHTTIKTGELIKQHKANK
jgi:hypothetical protein